MVKKKKNSSTEPLNAHPDKTKTSLAKRERVHSLKCVPTCSEKSIFSSFHSGNHPGMTSVDAVQGTGIPSVYSIVVIKVELVTGSIYNFADN